MKKVVDLDEYRERQVTKRHSDDLSAEELEHQVECVAFQVLEQVLEQTLTEYRINPVYFYGEVFRKVVKETSLAIKEGNDGAKYLLNFMDQVTKEWVDRHECRTSLKSDRGREMQDDYFFHRWCREEPNPATPPDLEPDNEPA